MKFAHNLNNEREREKRMQEEKKHAFYLHRIEKKFVFYNLKYMERYFFG
jgi:hypothetical protein